MTNTQSPLRLNELFGGASQESTPSGNCYICGTRTNQQDGDPSEEDWIPGVYICESCTQEKTCAKCSAIFAACESDYDSLCEDCGQDEEDLDRQEFERQRIA